MFGLKNCENCEYDVPKTIDEYFLKRENDRIKLHIRYICFIVGGILVWLIATGTSSDEKFPEWVSFASTITSIILSVLAIIMSITGEGKTEHIKEQLEATARDIKKSQKIVNQINGTIKESLDKVNDGMDLINKKIDSLPDVTAEKFSEFTRSKDDVDSRSENSSNLEI